MATPTPGEKLADKAPKPGLPQQGRTPSVFPAATPPVSTPFSHAHVAFSPRGPKSSPQQFKKSPATSATLMGHTNAPLNFDSPSAAAAMGALGIGGGLDLGWRGRQNQAFGCDHRHYRSSCPRSTTPFPSVERTWLTEAANRTPKDASAKLVSNACLSVQDLTRFGKTTERLTAK